MKVSLSWLKDFIDLTVVDPNELAKRLTNAGVEVSNVATTTKIPASVVVARIISRNQHPNADRLSLCKVEDGVATYDIVCGATNMQAGDKVALAKVGSDLPNGVSIKKSKIRGETSEGMLCAARELLLGEETDGIMILDAAAPLGQPLIDHLNLNDAVLELEITPNRGDCLSIVGVARELAALGCGTSKVADIKLRLEEKFAKSVFQAVAESASGNTARHSITTTEKMRVTINDTQRCPRYMLQRLQLDAMPSTPQWLQQRLQSAGLRTVNLVVDVTNYVMLEWGQPLHAFDFSKVAGQQINVRTATAGEKIAALDEKEYQLRSTDLVIADQTAPLCIAGVMGGVASSVTESSRQLLLESACFDAATVRHTAKGLGVNSDSSYRFERHVDPQVTPYALARACELLQEIAPTVRLGSSVEICPQASIVTNRNKIVYRLDRFTRVMGYAVDLKKTETIFKGLGCTLLETVAAQITLLAPSWRPDLLTEIDLIEEVARMYGVEHIPQTLPISAPDRHLERNTDTQSPAVRRYLTALGFSEVKNLAFVSAPEAAPWLATGKAPIKVSNPLGADLTVMRPSLLPSLLKNLSYNVRHFPQHNDLRFFELATVFRGEGEAYMVAGIAWKTESPTWRGKEAGLDFYWIKGLVENLTKTVASSKVVFSHDSNNSLPFLHPGAKSKLLLENKEIGSFGRVHPELLPEQCVEPVVAFEIDLGRLLTMSARKNDSIGYRAFSMYPAVERDIAVMVDEKIAAGQLTDLVRKLARPLLNEVTVIDLYTGEQLPKSQKSLALRLQFQSLERTLKDDEVDQLVAAAVKGLAEQFGAQLRS